MQVIRYFALKFPRQVQEAAGMVLSSDVWHRRSELQSQLKHSFDWFAERFDVTDDVGRRVLS
jgi:hypothetical protein